MNRVRNRNIDGRAIKGWSNKEEKKTQDKVIKMTSGLWEWTERMP